MLLSYCPWFQYAFLLAALVQSGQLGEQSVSCGDLQIHECLLLFILTYYREWHELTAKNEQ